jgi:2-keto-4-pentenoate hydratase/2-oxohepta-3-ene-1,7-dioic acid hydratase in catechol pathway
MKLAMIADEAEQMARPAVVTEENRGIWFEDILGATAPASLDAMIQDDGEGWLRRIREQLSKRAVMGQSLEHARFDAPISFIRNPFCIGRNYREHAEEAVRSGVSKAVQEDYPIFFTKATTTLNCHEGEIVAYAAAEGLDYEAELGVVLGRQGRGITKSNAESMIFGYTLVNDMTARVVQTRHQQWFLGKSFDGFCPVGPVIVTRDEMPWPLDVVVRLSVNGEERQRFSTRDMIFDIADQITWLSQSLTLLPGDLLATGTGDGVGRSFKPPRYLKPGDRMEIDCDAIGRLSNPFVKAHSAAD